MHDYSNIKFIEVYGLRRSGNHAIIAWLLHNLNESEDLNLHQLISPTPEEGFISQTIGNIIHLNDLASPWASQTGTYVRGLIDAYISIDKNIVLLSYEDVDYTFSLYEVGPSYKFLKDSTKIVITRDILNIVSSRLKKNKTGFKVNKTLFDRWLVNENISNNGTLIRFEDWLISKDYRDRIANILGLDNKDITDHVSNAGGGSSFKDQKSGKIDKNALLNRSNSIDIPKEIKDLLNSEEIILQRTKSGYIK
jgi:hypothetical protein